MSINDGKVNLFKKISNMCSNASDPIKDKYPIIKEWGREESFNDGKFFANNTAPGYSYSTVSVFKEKKAPVQFVGSDVPEKWKFADGLKNDAKGVAAQDKISQITAANRLLQRFNNPAAAEYVLGRKLTPDELLSKSVSGPANVEQRVIGVAGIPKEMALRPTVPPTMPQRNLPGQLRPPVLGFSPEEIMAFNPVRGRVQADLLPREVLDSLNQQGILPFSPDEIAQFRPEIPVDLLPPNVLADLSEQGILPFSMDEILQFKMNDLDLIPQSVLKDFPQEQVQNIVEEEMKANKGKEEAYSEYVEDKNINDNSYFTAIEMSEKVQELNDIGTHLAFKLDFTSMQDLITRIQAVRKAIAGKPPNQEVLKLAVKSAGFKSVGDFISAQNIMVGIIEKRKDLAEFETPKKPKKPVKPTKPKPQPAEASSAVPEEEEDLEMPPPYSPAVFSESEIRTKIQTAAGRREIIDRIKNIKGTSGVKVNLQGLHNTSEPEKFLAILRKLSQGDRAPVLIGKGIRRQNKRKPKQTQATPDDVDFAKEKLKVLVGSIDAGDMPNKTLVNQLSTVLDFLLYHNAIPKALAIKITKKALGR